MVFSFFKKDPKEAKKGPVARAKHTPSAPRGGATEVATRPAAKPIGRPLTGPAGRSGDRTSPPSNGTSLPDRERARDHARQTAAKIDAIEAEMARDIMGAGRSTRVPSPHTALPPLPTDPPTRITTTAKVTETIVAEESNSELLVGNIDAIEINTAGGGSVIDESAILFSNGQLDAAESVLRAGLRSDDLGSATRTAWRMLFELVNQRGDREGFEKLAMDYALRFESAPPPWIDYTEVAASKQVPAASAPAPGGGWPGVRLPDSIDASIIGRLERLRGLTAAHAAVQLDVSDARSIDIAGAGLLLRVIGAFRRSQRELTLVGAENLATALSGSVESGRRDPSDALWMLLLEVLRMLGRHEEFEEAAIQYCITFEVSPPSWEPAPGNLTVAAATSAPPAASEETPAAAPAGSAFELRGIVDGDGEPHFSRLLAAARNRPEVIIDCEPLRRLTFSAGSALIGTLRRMTQGGSSVELHNVSALVSALLHLLGIDSIAALRSRYR